MSDEEMEEDGAAEEDGSDGEGVGGGASIGMRGGMPETSGVGAGGRMVEFRGAADALGPRV